jgi:Na+/melibiose symporter-like transporter
VFLPLYIIDTISTLNRVFVAIAPLSSYVSGLLASFPMRIINKRIGRKWTLMIGILFILASTVLYWFIYQFQSKLELEIMLILACVLFGIGTSTTSICSSALTSDLIGLNTECGAFVYGTMSFADKLANGIVIALIQQFNPCKPSSTSPETCANFYRYILTFIPVGVSVFTILMILSIWKTDIGGNRHDLIPEENVNHQTTTINSEENEYDEQSSLLT